MLKGIDPVLTPELLKLLMEMGHDDAIVLADANFTAVRYAGGKPIIRLPGIGMARAVQAVTSLLPLVADEVHPVGFMQVSGQSAEAIERFAFYERTKSAFAIVLTGEQQPFGNFLLRKGVIGETLRP